MATQKRTVTLQSTTILALEALSINGKLSQGIELLYRDSLLKAGTKVAQDANVKDSYGRNAKAEKEAADRAADIAAEEKHYTIRQKERLAEQLKHYREVGQPMPFEKESPLMTAELKAEALAKFQAWKMRDAPDWQLNRAELEIRYANQAAKAIPAPAPHIQPQDRPMLVPASEANEDDGFTQAYIPAPVKTGPTLAEYLEANPWPDDADFTE